MFYTLCLSPTVELRQLTLFLGSPQKNKYKLRLDCKFRWKGSEPSFSQILSQKNVNDSEHQREAFLIWKTISAWNERFIPLVDHLNTHFLVRWNAADKYLSIREGYNCTSRRTDTVWRHVWYLEYLSTTRLHSRIESGFLLSLISNLVFNIKKVSSVEETKKSFFTGDPIFQLAHVWVTFHNISL